MSNRGTVHTKIRSWIAGIGLVLVVISAGAVGVVFVLMMIDFVSRAFR